MLQGLCLIARVRLSTLPYVRPCIITRVPICIISCVTLLPCAPPPHTHTDARTRTFAHTGKSNTPVSGGRRKSRRAFAFSPKPTASSLHSRPSPRCWYLLCVSRCWVRSCVNVCVCVCVCARARVRLSAYARKPVSRLCLYSVYAAG